MNELAALVSALTTLLVTISAIVLGVLGYRRRDLLVSFVRDRNIALGPLTLGLSQPSADTRPALLPPGTEKAAAPPAVGETAPAVEEHEEGQWYSLMKAGKYADGVRILREEAARKETPDERINLTALGYFLGFLEGSPKGAEDLTSLVEEQPANVTARMYLARVLARTGHTEAAELELRRALESCRTETQREPIVRQHARLLAELDRIREAVQVLAQELRNTSDALVRSSLFVGIAEAHLKAKPKAVDDAMLAYELAVRERPTDKDLRFTVAYAYGQHGAPGLAFHHYQVLIEGGMASGVVFNNAGVAAGELGLVTTAVDYLRRSEAQGESLASSNLASRLLSAGFAKEATDILKAVLTGAGTNARVFSVLAEAGSVRENESSKIEIQAVAIQRHRRWRWRYAEAILGDAPDASAVAGQYTGAPDLTLVVDAAGEVAGTFQTGGIIGLEPATLKGRIRGRAVRFTWRLSKADSWTRPSSGHGVLLWSEDGLSGFRGGGAATLDARDNEEWTAWELKRT